MYCNHCGKAIQDDAIVCAYCGWRLGVVHRRRELVRPIHGRKISGVSIGFANYMDVDVTLMRLIWLLMAIFTFPLAEIAYLVCWIVIPEGSDVVVVVPNTAPVADHQ